MRCTGVSCVLPVSRYEFIEERTDFLMSQPTSRYNISVIEKISDLKM